MNRSKPPKGPRPPRSTPRPGPGKPSGKRPFSAQAPAEGATGKGAAPERSAPASQHPAKPRAPRSGAARDRGSRNPGGNRYWLTGTHPVLAALANPERRLGRLLATAGGVEQLGDAAHRAEVTVEIVERAEIERLTGPDEVHQGLALEVLPLEPQALGDLPDPHARHPLLILDQVTDPRNVGAILRTAAVFGAVAVMVQDRHAPPETAALAKAASGALETVPLVRVGNLARAMEEVKQAGYWTIGLSGDATDTLASLPADRPIALVLGAEGDGMRRLTQEACDRIVRIAMAPNPVGSLNVSNAAAVALYAATLATDTMQ